MKPHLKKTVKKPKTMAPKKKSMAHLYEELAPKKKGM